MSLDEGTGKPTARTVAGRKLRDYQMEALEAMESAPDGSHLVQMATGLGKTVTMAGYRRQGRMLILSHRDELVHQPAKYFDCPVGFEQASEHSHGEEVVSASVQSLVRRLDDFRPGDFDVIFTDEAHHALARSYRKVYDRIRPRLHFGLTATPRRGDDRGLDSVFDDIIFQRDLRWGIEHEWLSGIDCRRVTVSWSTARVHRQGGDFRAGELDAAVNSPATNEQVAAAYESLRVGQTLVFASSVDHAHALAALIPGARVVDGKTPSDVRRQTIADFTARRFPCLVNYGVFTEGTDMPLVETVLIARPTQNPTLYTQMVGRGLRKAEGKGSLRLIDCVGVSEDRRLCTPPTLFGLNESDFPENARTPDVLDGDLMDLERRVHAVSDTPLGWVLSARKVDVLGGGHGIAWVPMPDGTRVVSGSGWEVEVSAPDLVDHVTATLHWHGDVKHRDFASFLDADEHMWDLFGSYSPYREDRNLWDTALVGRWGREAATPNQMGYIRTLVGDAQASELAGISKYEAQCVIMAARRRQGEEDASEFGLCPRCGRPLRESKTGRSYVCSSNHYRKLPDGTWQLREGCGTTVRATTPDGVAISPEQLREALETGIFVDGRGVWALDDWDGDGWWSFRHRTADSLPPESRRLGADDPVWEGMRVIHEKFGPGEVTAFKTEDDTRRLTVRFAGDVTRELVQGLAPLELVGRADGRGDGS